MAGGHPAGGSAGLGELIEAGHGAALLADFQRYYRLDLADVWRGRLSPRRAMVLAEHLPEDSALAASLAGGPEHRGWTLQTHLLAHLLNAVRFADANNVRVNGGKLKRDPEPVKTPGTARRRSALDLSTHPLALDLP
ncbi:hypothetical protein OG196_15180 [Kitasatospora purpeofusca]|uniref:hypothetical protein n=1 Tax=Kitasatospora purpeofusca TaxID=67352 RepID=UPI002E163D0A|nr:hypothetical protein OG196_15180 [Kitasatospora purpeofusca]